jgi:hypothetical protein
MTESRKRAVIGSESLDFPSISAGETAELSFDRSKHYGDARAGDAVALGPPANFPPGLVATGYVDAADDIVVRVHNTTAGAIDPSAGAVAAQGTLTLDTQPLDLDTVVVGGVTYTFLDSFVDAVDNIFTGADLAASKVNLTAAINASGGTPGTTHYTNQVVNPTVTNATFISDDSIFEATVAGEAGNDIVTDDTGFDEVTNVFDAATLGTTTAGVNGEDALWSFALII